MTDITAIVEKDILEALESDQLELPTLPEVALSVREVADDPYASVSDLAQVIGSDAAISARIIKVCNSPLLRANQTVENLNMAVNRLGMKYSADLATGLAMSQMFQATSDVVDSCMRDSWTRSKEVAGICLTLAQGMPSLRIAPAQAMLAGLTHRIGVLPILRFAEDHPDILADSISLEAVIEKLHPSLGHRIMTTWDFSDELCQVPLEHLNFERNSDTADLVDLVMVANLQSYAGSHHPYTQLDWSQIPAFAKLGLDPDTEEEEEDLSENMKAALALLD